MAKPAHNPTDSPVVVDGKGHTLGGGEWGAVDPDLPEVKSAIEEGQLVVFDSIEASEDTNPHALEAAQAANPPGGRRRAGEPKET